jgi:Na+/melibiose symporter-like transporter
MNTTGPPADAQALASATGGGWRGGWRDGLRYGGLGLPLAFVALPLYVVLPNHYAVAYGVPLAALGTVLLLARLLDAAVDPWIGRWVDGWFTSADTAGNPSLHPGRHPRQRGRPWRALRAAALAGLVLAAGFAALFHPPSAIQADPAWLLAWCAATLALAYFAYSVLAVLHQAWGARLGGDEAQRARIVSWREGLALAGVLMASVLPSLAGIGFTALAFAVLLAVGIVLLHQAPAAQPAPLGRPQAQPDAGLPWQGSAFRRLMAVYLVNGIASAVPATLVLFFIRDRLQAAAFEPLFLASYFAAGALSMPLWVRLVRRLGLARAWQLGMGLAVAAFVWAALLGAGDVAGFTVVCIASGVALGADLALPGALLAGVVQRAGHGGRLEGAYFGWWNFATKLNLALAAGIALPVLAAFGYTPGAQDAQALQALTIAYCLLPCALKLLAAGLLHLVWIRGEPG